MAFERRMRALPLARIRLTDPFWTRWQRLLAETTLPLQFDLLESTGRLENFRRAASKVEGGHQGRIFNDSDVYKWIEACACVLAIHPSASLRAKMEQAIDTVISAQMPDGYLNTFFQLEHPDKRFKNLYAMHEMYCAGHLIEAAVAAYQNLGEERLLDAGIRFADHIMSIFGSGKRLGYPGHEEIELGLVRLAEATGEQRYREFARWLVDVRGSRPSVFAQEFDDPIALGLAPWGKAVFERDGVYSGDYAQDHAPVREHDQVVGHAVRAMYLYTAAAELADGKNDSALESALERAWSNLTTRRMYVTGGIGPSASNEGFTADFDLPNLSAYAETCAAIGLIFWGRRMLEMTGRSDYADVIERALYNGAISGISLDGKSYFYDNPLESRGKHARTPWFDCACCPPNLARLLGDLGQYVASEAGDGFYIHHFAGFDADAKIGEVPVHVQLESEFPWAGTMTLRVNPERAFEFAIRIRIPEWSDDVSLEADGLTEEAEYENGYAVIRRTWNTGDVIHIDLGISPRWLESDPRVRDNLGRAALTRGPLVYCAESPDLGFAPQLFTADLEAEVVEDSDPNLHGIKTLTVQGLRELEEGVELYERAGTVGLQECDATLIPYYAWANRGPSEMQVWLRSM